MNKECRAEIDRLISRTNPPPAISPLMILAKWVYLDAARIASQAGRNDIANAIEARTSLRPIPPRFVDPPAAAPLTPEA